ncbi:MAG: hypothetical protein OXF56_10260 [Rhodobacteraceae bacterium]|nr:hypothetical protein [Paracoccaceae bacterium]
MIYFRFRELTAFFGVSGTCTRNNPVSGIAVLFQAIDFIGAAGEI